MRILAIAPHPDDETLGCGGTLLRHKDEGDQVFWLIVAGISVAAGFSAKAVASRDGEIDAVAQAYGFDGVYRLKHITARLDTVPMRELIDDVGRVISEVQPNTIYMPYWGDVHSDHKLVFDAVAPCTKSYRYTSIRRIRAYETLSETEFGLRLDHSGFLPNLWVDVSKYLDKKIEIMRLYQGEIGEFPFPRSDRNLRALATLRGATAGCEAAEAFISLREIV